MKYPEGLIHSVSGSCRQVYYGNTLHPDQLKASLSAQAATSVGAAPPHLPSSTSPTPTPPPAANQRVMVRRVTRRYSYVSQRAEASSTSQSVARWGP